MKINDKCKLFLRDVYSYDIQSCHTTIMNRIGMDTSFLDKNDKQKRNTQIGILQRNNPHLIPIFRNITESLIDEYISKNNLKPDDIICRQYDGFISLKPLKDIKLYIELPLREIFDYLLIDRNRTSYIGYNFLSERISIKGVSDRSFGMDSFYKKMMKINFANKKAVFSSMNKIKNEILTSDDINTFMIPRDNKVALYMRDYGEVEVAPNLAKLMGCEEIDKKYYFNKYLSPFFKSIVMEFF